MPSEWHRPNQVGLYECLNDTFNGGYYADKVLERKFKQNRKWGSRDRRQIAEAFYDIVRWWRKLRVMAELPWPAPSPVAESDFEAVFEQWKTHHEDLRNLEVVPGARALNQSMPDWIDEMAAKELGDTWDQILPVLNEQASIFLRTNELKVDKATLAYGLTDEGIEVESVNDGPCLKLKKRANVFRTEAFKEGLFEVQDKGSQEIAPFCNVEPGMRVVDACAGAGGKTLHLADLMKNKGQIIALDIHQWKLGELKKRARRAGAHNIEARHLESSKVIKRLKGQADRTLLDVPCSGLGVLKRNPDSKWKLSREECDRLKTLQAEILQEYSATVKPGGYLIYSTCSLMPFENRAQVDQFLSEHSNWEFDEDKTLLPESGGGDGFYMARLKRLS